MLADADTRIAVQEMLDRFFHLVSTRDRRVLAGFGPGGDAFLIGSDAGEIARGPQEIEAFFTRLSHHLFTTDEHQRQASLHAIGHDVGNPCDRASRPATQNR